MEDDAADRDARVERAAGQRIQHRARIRPSPVALELGDDLHRAHFRRTGDCARGEACPQELERRDAGGELARDLRDEVRDVREAFCLEEPLDRHRAGAAHAREIVAAEIDEHHVLRAILAGAEQPLGVALARVRRAGDRVHRRARPLAPDERLGRRADERHAVELEQEEVGRRVHVPQGAVDRERGDGRAALGALREDDLEGVAAADVLLARLDAALVLEARRQPPRRCARRGLARRPRHLGLEHRRRLVRVAREHLGDPACVIEADEDVGDDEAALGQPAAVLRERNGRLELRDEVVREVPHDGLAGGLRVLVRDDARAAADERVAAEAAALHRLEQEARACLAAQVEVRAERRQEVGGEERGRDHVRSSWGRKKTPRGLRWSGAGCPA